jgi:matrix metalloproteinase-14 (membrane-inserted)
MDQDDIDGITHIYGKNSPTYKRPPICETDTEFDAIEVIDGDIHAFKGDNYWLISEDGSMSSPTRRIQARWRDVPSNLDAVVSFDMNKGPVFFFKNEYYWRYNKSNSLQPITSRLIREGFPGIPDKVDAAFVWSRNGGLYFIKGNSYYRYRYGDPRALSAYWRGITGASAAFQHPDKQIYFYSGRNFRVFNETTYRAGPQQSTDKWLGCSDGRGRMFGEQAGNMDRSSAETSSDVHSQLFKLFIQLVCYLLCMVSQSL